MDESAVAVLALRIAICEILFAGPGDELRRHGRLGILRTALRPQEIFDSASSGSRAWSNPPTSNRPTVHD